MTSNRRALVLLLLVACSCPLFSDRENCRQTEEFEMGIEAARNRCYLDGYDRETRRNRIRGALLGGAVTWILLLAEGFGM